MATITELSILNPADKSRMFSVATGKGVPSSIEDPSTEPLMDAKVFPVGSQYIDLEYGGFYVRMKAEGTTDDWSFVGGNYPS